MSVFGYQAGGGLWRLWLPFGGIGGSLSHLGRVLVAGGALKLCLPCLRLLLGG